MITEFFILSLSYNNFKKFIKSYKICVTGQMLKLNSKERWRAEKKRLNVLMRGRATHWLLDFLACCKSQDLPSRYVRDYTSAQIYKTCRSFCKHLIHWYTVECGVEFLTVYWEPEVNQNNTFFNTLKAWSFFTTSVWWQESLHTFFIQQVCVSSMRLNLKARCIVPNCTQLNVMRYEIVKPA